MSSRNPFLGSQSVTWRVLVTPIVAGIVLASATLVCAQHQRGGVLAAFERSAQVDETREVASGAVFLSVDGVVCVRVTHPIRQTIVRSDLGMVIYYPSEGRAFALHLQDSTPSGLDVVLMNAREMSRQLENAGYVLENYESNEDTLECTWARRESAKRGGNVRIETVSVGERVLRMASHASDGTHHSTVDLSGHVQVGPCDVPLVIEQRDITGARSGLERWVLDDPRWVEDPPDSLRGVDIPDSVTITEFGAGDG